MLSEYDEFSRCSVQDRPVDILISNIDRLPENKEDLWDGPWDWFAYEIADRSRLEKCLASRFTFKNLSAIIFLIANHNVAALCLLDLIPS